MFWRYFHHDSSVLENFTNFFCLFSWALREFSSQIQNLSVGQFKKKSKHQTASFLHQLHIKWKWCLGHSSNTFFKPIMKRKARNTTYKCPVLQCAQSTCMFKKRTQLIEHMNNSELCSPFVKQCQGCGDQFEADYNLKYHLRSKTRCQNITDEAGRSF